MASYSNVLARMVSLPDAATATPFALDPSLADQLAEAHDHELARLEKILTRLLSQLVEANDKLQRAADDAQAALPLVESAAAHDEAVWAMDVATMFSRELWRKEELMGLMVAQVRAPLAWETPATLSLVHHAASSWPSRGANSFVDWTVVASRLQ